MIEGEPQKYSPSSVEVNGVRVFGEKAGRVEPREIDEIASRTDLLLHLTRHLASLSPEAKQRLCELRVRVGQEMRPVDDAYLAKQTETAGSKFHPAVDDPYKLIDFCVEKLRQMVSDESEIPWVRLETGEWRATLQIPITPEDKAEFGIPSGESFGTASVVEITPELQARVEKEARGKGEAVDGITVNVIRGMPEPPSDNLIVVIRKRNEGEPAQLYTAYTGVPAPALPRPDKQSPEELSYNSEWWEKHAFIKP
ncbi:MAG: hypothetical protein WC497_01600 [Patescibacteria group bacterium]